MYAVALARQQNGGHDARAQLLPQEKRSRAGPMNGHRPALRHRPISVQAEESEQHPDPGDQFDHRPPNLNSFHTRMCRLPW